MPSIEVAPGPAADSSFRRLERMLHGTSGTVPRKKDVAAADASPPNAGASPWWVEEFVSLRAKLVAYAVNRGLFSEAEDIVSNVATSLTRDLGGGASTLGDDGFIRDTWFGHASPPDDDAGAFHAFVWRLMKLRAADELRRKYVRTRAEPLLKAEAPEAPDPRNRLEAREFLATLTALVDALPVDEKALLLDDEPGQRRTNADRQRLFRLRRRLAEQLDESLRKQGK